MPRISPVFESDNRDRGPLGYAFLCPGCDRYHEFRVRLAHDPHPLDAGAVWAFNGDVERPTFQGSLLARWDEGPNHEQRVCHSFVRDGQIQFLSDCTHPLAGQTIDLPEVEAT